MRICPQCHAAARLDESYCAWCGTALPPQQDDDLPQPAPAQPPSPGSAVSEAHPGWSPPPPYQYSPAPSPHVYSYQLSQPPQYPYQSPQSPPYPQQMYAGPPPSVPYSAPPSYAEQAVAPWQPLYVAPAPRRVRALPVVLVGVGLAVVLAILVPIFLLSSGGAAAGTWYGPFGLDTANGYTRAEVLLNLHQTSDGSIWGSGELCMLSGQQTVTGGFPATGRASGTSLDLTWEVGDASLGIPNLDWHGSVSGQGMTLSYLGKGQTGYTFTLRRGSRGNYLAACQAST